MSQYIYRILETIEIDGERTYVHIAVHKLDDDVNPEEFLQDLVEEFWGESETIDGDVWFFGEIITRVYSWSFITKKEFNVLNKFI